MRTVNKRNKKHKHSVLKMEITTEQFLLIVKTY